jgi:hypothetical protein
MCPHPFADSVHVAPDGSRITIASEIRRVSVHPPAVSARGSLYRISDGPHVFIPFGLLLSEKQIPRFVGNVSS